MKKLNILIGVLLLMINLIFISCKKQDDFLNQKPSASLSLVSSLSDCQLLLNNEGVFNQNYEALGHISSDDYYLPTNIFNILDPIQRNSYLWAKVIYPPGIVGEADWFGQYNRIYNANVVLDALPSINFATNETIMYNQIKGSALFFRAISFYNLLQAFAPAYNASSAATDLGVPLRLSSDINIKYGRASVQQSYDQVIADLNIAANLVSTNSTYPTQPSKTAVYGLLARLYLVMGDYNNALTNANLCLALNNTIVDYNTITPGPYSLITKGYLQEDIFHSILESYNVSQGASRRAIIDTTLYSSYNNNDLRKTLFVFTYAGHLYFRGSYDFQRYGYNGIATDEIYLIRAESYARTGNTSAALIDLNTLLIKRWKTGTFTPLTASTADIALSLVLTERRKELLFRGIRWSDLRRLNKEPRFAITLTRVINGVTYTLPPNDPRYTLPIPDDEIQLNGIPQNIR